MRKTSNWVNSTREVCACEKKESREREKNWNWKSFHSGSTRVWSKRRIFTGICIFISQCGKLVPGERSEKVSQKALLRWKEKKKESLTGTYIIQHNQALSLHRKKKRKMKLKTFQSICLVEGIQEKFIFPKSMNYSEEVERESERRICTFILMAIHFIRNEKASRFELFCVPFMSRSFWPSRLCHTEARLNTVLRAHFFSECQCLVSILN